jgi:hypothetical protein
MEATGTMTPFNAHATTVQWVDREPHSTAVTSAGTDSPPQAAADPSAGAELQALIERIEDYLRQQIRRLERTIDPTCSVAAEEQAVRELIADHERERQEWESERHKERARLDEEANLLLDAWGRLEAEHRRLLGLQETLRASSASPAAPGSRQNRFNQTSPLAPREICQTNNRDGEVPDEQKDFAWLQFQQLKREIQKHRSRHAPP